MPRPDKASAVAELTTAFRDSSAAVLTEYRGLTVAELKELRRSLQGNATYVVVKNTLSKIAAREAGVEALDELMTGPSAIAFVNGDPVTVAKGLRDFNREHPLLVIKGGVLDGAPLSADDIKKLANLESREVLLAKLAGGLNTPASQLASVLMAPVRQLAQVLGALAAKAAADPNWGGGDGASATDPAPAAADEVPAEPAAEAAEPAPEPAPEAGEPAAEAAEPATEETTDGVADASSDS
ncbi:MAG TPA: 50S ribosomal protein L10 [Mycobacteriales bacterium]|nr:50S ribosomal protein L10 [Mycobacteriales bacterium]